MNDFFFTTRFYANPMSAYNADAVYDTVYGNTDAKKTIGIFEIDEEKTLFIGELTRNRFLVAEMNVKDKKYAYEGTVFFYDYDGSFDENYYNQTKTKSGYMNWTIVFDRQDVLKLSNVKLVKEYFLSTGSPLFLIIFE